MYGQPGDRVTKINSGRARHNNTPTVFKNHAGWAYKTEQIDRFTRPTDAAVTTIAISERFVLAVTGVHEVVCEDDLAALAEGDLLWIDVADDTVKRVPAGSEEAAATLTVGASNSKVKVTANEGGDDGNDITLAIIDPPGNNVALSVDTDGDDIIVTAATDGSSAITSTAAQVIAAINEHDVASQLVTAANGASSDGTGVVAAVAETPLAGGGAGADTGDLPLGVVDKIDSTRSPAVARVNMDDLRAFMAA